MFKKLSAMLGVVFLLSLTMPAAQADYTINLGPKTCRSGEFVGTYVNTYSPIVVHGFTGKNGQNRELVSQRPAGLDGFAWSAQRTGPLMQTIDTYVRVRGDVKQRYAFCEWKGMAVYSVELGEDTE